MKRELVCELGRVAKKALRRALQLIRIKAPARANEGRGSRFAARAGSRLAVGSRETCKRLFTLDALRGFMWVLQG